MCIPGGEPLAGQGLGAVGAGEAFPVPGVVAVGHAALGDHLHTQTIVSRRSPLTSLTSFNQ